MHYGIIAFGQGLEVNTVLSFASYCICLSTCPLTQQLP